VLCCRMTPDIFDFWAECPPNALIHPRDVPVFRRAGNMGFKLDCLPCNIWGPLKTAPVVLLYLSPGFSATDVDYAKSPRGQATYRRRRQGNEPLDSKDEHEPGWRWWTARAKAFGDSAMISDKLAILNIGAYHSETFKDAHALMALPSSRAAIDYAQTMLFPEAERGERVVICLRKPRAWGLTIGKTYRGTLFAPRTNAAGHMVNGPERESVVKAARIALSA